MEQVEHAVGVDAHGAAGGRRVGLVAGRVCELADGRRGHGGLGLVGDHGVAVGAGVGLDGDGLAAALAGDALGDVDAGLGGVAGLARVEGLSVAGGAAGGGGLVCVGALALARVGARRVGLLVGGGGADGLRGGGVALLGRGVAGLGLDGLGVVHLEGAGRGVALALAGAV